MCLKIKRSARNRAKFRVEYLRARVWPAARKISARHAGNMLGGRLQFRKRITRETRADPLDLKSRANYRISSPFADENTNLHLEKGEF